MAYLHTGTYRSRKYNIDRYMHATDAEMADIKAPTRRGWKPIVHQDNHNGNIWIHYPSDEEKAQDPRLERFTEELPQVVLGDFGLAINVDPATQTDREKEYLLMNGDYEKYKWDIPEKVALKDLSFFAQAVKELLAASRFCVYLKADAPDFDNLHPLNPSGNSRARRTLRGYSNSLKQLAARLEPLICINFWEEDNRAPTPWGNYGPINNVQNIIEHYENAGMDKPWFEDNWPTRDYLYGTMIAMADVRVARYLAGIPDPTIPDEVAPRSLLDTTTVCYPLDKQEWMLETFEETGDGWVVKATGAPGKLVKDKWPTGGHHFVTAQYSYFRETAPEVEPLNRAPEPSPPSSPRRVLTAKKTARKHAVPVPVPVVTSLSPGVV